ncbi:hypothetical protein [Pseudonocardia sp. TRM90224]|uniref:hypothetical protein n=1 Tax=Pseudonocardia sp. TRM90224 TaxID=2812678 RepID=UPI001E3B8EDF|nr:hypothetical protein [Pseudonocardia sp. TRM90224]
MNRVPTIAAVTGGLLVLGGVVAGGIAFAGEETAPAPRPAYVTVDDSPRAGLANTQQTPGDRDCPKGPAAESGAAQNDPADGAAPVTSL